MSNASSLDLNVDAWARSQRRAALGFGVAIVLVVVAAIGFIWYTASTVSAARTELATLNQQLDDARAELAATETQLGQSQQEVAAAQAARDEASAEVRQAVAAAAALQNDLETSQDSLDETRQHLESALTELEDARSQMAALEEQIGLSIGFREHLHPVDLEDAKLLASISDRLAHLLALVLRFQEDETPFSSANEPGVGFNSPGFANFVLSEIEPGMNLAALPATSDPKLGDIVEYEGGFALFLLQDADAQPFVIGMTPAGIASLEPDFGVPRSGARSTGLLDQ